MVRLHTRGGRNRLAQDFFRIVFCNFLDFHSTGSAGHEDGHAGNAIHKNADVEFTLDVEAFFDQQAMNDAALFASLRR